ncbi:endonuclease III [Desulfohalobium retbaense]|uniref:Endonuclease III n=1 Tax=Desulfohalobium retbaense (strain ATCC 49708 / DSM 5692 / JCM 16813 / HR100) TaxID=485915 RepID=C8X120_DESRD|nr:endonuclease III [Desulfohalobium retbaense]ACV68117.1 endonuclease III [Desulfohalobium retbaense DSM 5692]
MQRMHRAGIVLERLAQRYPRPASALQWQSPWELLVATVLSAQCTDQRVNAVTPGFFHRWPDPESLAQAEQEEVEQAIRSTGFFRNKSKNLLATAQRIVKEHEGQVPDTMSQLLALPGVARKTANIVLSNAFGHNEGIAVDTHVKRLANRLGLTDAKDPNHIEQDLMPLFPQNQWGALNHYLVLFGREVCKARSPLCSQCPLYDICPRYGVPS